MAGIEKKTKRYPSDLTDEEWSVIAPFLPGPAATGRKRRVDLREVMNAIRYMVRSGCEWRMLPIHFSPWQTVYWWFRRFVRLLLFRTIHDVALMIDRERSGRHADPSAAVIDSQSIKAPAAGTRGFGGAKKIGSQEDWEPRRLGAKKIGSQEDCRPQAPHRSRYRRAPAHGQPHHLR